MLIVDDAKKLPYQREKQAKGDRDPAEGPEISEDDPSRHGDQVWTVGV